MQRKPNILIGIKVVAFLLTFAALFQTATYILRPKAFISSVKPIYDLPKNSIDVLLFGSSHMNTVVSPMDLWNEYGITSFNAAIGDQTIPATYFEIRELLKVQRPKVIVMEMYNIWQPNMMTANGEERLHWLVDNVPMSRNLSQAIQTLISQDSDKTEYYLNLYAYHNRWQELKQEDFEPAVSYNYGGDIQVYNRHTEFEPYEPVPGSQLAAPPEPPVEYLYKIIALCKQEGIPLVLMASPFYAKDWVAWQEQANWVGQVAQIESIPYLNFMYLTDEIGFDYRKDMAESSHMNYFGARKVTSYLGAYLQEHFKLEDHRGTGTIAAKWDADYDVYAKVVQNMMLKWPEHDGTSYLKAVQEGGYTILWSAYGNEQQLSSCLEQAANLTGYEFDIEEHATYFYALTEDGAFQHQFSGVEPNHYSGMFDDTLFNIGITAGEAGNSIALRIGGKLVADAETGLNIAVYDPVTHAVVDAVNINLADWSIRR